MKMGMELCPSWSSPRLGCPQAWGAESRSPWDRLTWGVTLEGEGIKRGVPRESRGLGNGKGGWKHRGLEFKPLDYHPSPPPQALEKMNIEQKMSIRILK